MRGGMAKGFGFFLFYLDLGVEDSCVEGWLRVWTSFFCCGLRILGLIIYGWVIV